MEHKVSIEGIIAPVTTPFLPDESIDFDAFAENLRYYVTTELTGVLVAGTTGEGPHLAPSERKRLLEVASTEAGRLQVWAGLPGQSKAQSLRELETWQDLPVAGVLAGVPNYYRPRMTEGALEAFYRGLADASPFPILLYNIPKLSGVDLAPGLVARLARHPAIIGIKESSGNLSLVQRLLGDTSGEEFEVVCGSGEAFGAVVDLGVRSGILAAACMAPEVAVEVWRSSGKPRSVAMLRRLLFELAATVVSGMGIPGIKHAMERLGLRGGRVRAPLLPLSEEELRRLNSFMDEFLALRDRTCPAAGASGVT